MALGYFPYTHLESQILTIKQLIERPDLHDSYFVNITPVELLDTGNFLSTSSTLYFSNRELIFRLYTKEDKVKYPTADDIDENAPIKLNTIIYVKEKNIRRDLLFSQTLNIEKTFSSNAFISQRLKELMSNKDYIRSYTDSNDTPNKVRKQVAEIQVFVWVRGSINNEPLSQVDTSRALGVVEDELTIGDITNPEKNKPLKPTKESKSIEGSWLDISPFIEQMNTSVTESGGNFSFSISPVVGTYDEKEGWLLDPYFITNHINSDIRNSYTAKTVLHKIQNGELKRNQFLFNNLLSENDLVYIRFESLKLEEVDRNNLKQKLRLTGNDIPSQVNPINGEMTQERIYDMIGFIDSNSVQSNFSSSGISITISGRDLVKTIIDDGTYFFPQEFASGMFLSPGDADRNNSRMIKRCLFTGSLQNLSIYYEKSIQTIMQFVISQLSNTGYVPNSVFYGYRERRNTTIISDKDIERIQTTERKNRTEYHRAQLNSCISKARTYYRVTNVELNRNENTGIKNATTNDIAKLVFDFAQFIIDQNIAIEVTGNNNFSNFFLESWNPWKKGSVFKSTFKNLSETASKGQLRFEGIYPTSFEGYLYPENQYVFRKELGLKNNGNTSIIHISVSEALSHAYAFLRLQTNTIKEQFKQVPLQGVWQIINLLIDPSVKNRVLVDTSIAQEQGSLINTFNKICQKPLVEFFTDTYGDKFYFIVRKPPTDQVSILGMVYGTNISTETNQVNGQDRNIQLDKDSALQNSTDTNRDNLLKDKEVQFTNVVAESTKIVSDQNTGIIIDIDEGDIIQDSLSWYSGEVYSWYRIEPKAYLFGNSGSMTWEFLPAIYFEEYSDIWGSRPLLVSTTYYPVKKDNESDLSFKQNPILTQSYYDLKYMIESHSYLPFTRQGQITLSNGDRRIKRGIFIRLKGTGEIAYVDAVTQNFSSTSTVNRSTTISVSRVMVEKYLKPQKIQGISKPVSYFDIIDTNLKLSERQENDNSTNQSNQDSIVDLRPETVLSNFRVNKEVFNFFLQRRQKSNI